jgi:hypothetical protein
LLTGHATYSANSKNRVERVSACSEPIRPRRFHVLNNRCRRHAAFHQRFGSGGEVVLTNNLVRLNALQPRKDSRLPF